jgi:hypothetical protein
MQVGGYCGCAAVADVDKFATAEKMILGQATHVQHATDRCDFGVLAVISRQGELDTDLNGLMRVRTLNVGHQLIQSLAIALHLYAAIRQIGQYYRVGVPVGRNVGFNVGGRACAEALEVIVAVFQNVDVLELLLSFSIEDVILTFNQRVRIQSQAIRICEFDAFIRFERCLTRRSEERWTGSNSRSSRCA